MNYALPPLYRPWMDGALGKPVLSEPRATCNNCVMCAHLERSTGTDYCFNPNTKCCAYHPSLPNFLVGAVLADPDPAFREAKDQFIRGAMAARVTPIGINPPYFTKMFYKLKTFGKHEQIRCPFYMHHVGGMCAIWKYRNARCSTWFCKHERGRTGLRFWNALDDMMAFAEQKLASRCVDDLQVTIPEHPSDSREATWGNWTYREQDFFLACWDKIQSLIWDEVLQIGGRELELLTAKAKTALEQLDTPGDAGVLVKSNFTSEELGDGTVRIWAYSSFNPVDLPRKVVEVLDYFDGRPVQTVIAHIEEEKGARIDSVLLGQLSDYEILVPAKTCLTENTDDGGFRAAE